MNIKDYLTSVSNELLHFCPNPGNGGDAFISHATYQLFDELKIKYKIVKSTDNLAGKIIVYGGGGNLVDYYSYGADFLEKHFKESKKLIVFPHTINAGEKLLKLFNNNTDIICREKKSFNFVKNTETNANVILMDDMAFNINIEKTFSDAKKISNKTQFDLHYFSQSNKFRLAKVGRCLYRTSNNNTLNSFRIDQERTSKKIPRDNFDISIKFGILTFTPNIALRISCLLLKYLDKFEIINTNRLHMGIGGAILGKEVNFYPNSYWKNECVYHYSMKNKYQNVNWMG